MPRRHQHARRRFLPAAAIALALLTLPAGAQANEARITAERKINDRVLELTVATPALAAPTQVTVDLPAGYEQAPARRWPVTYYLAGTTHTDKSFNDFYDGENLTRSFPSIVVAPTGASGYWSDWFNAGTGGPPAYETFVIDQLLPLIDARFRTVSDRAGRAVMGESMGGYGAMMYAARHPDLFAAASSLSGAVDSDLPLNGAVLSASSTFDGAAPDAIYGPRSSQEIRWRGHNPADLASNLHDVNLQVGSANGSPDLALNEGPAGTAQCPIEVGVHMASISFHDVLNGLRIPHAYRDYGAGCHSRPNFERQIADSLPILQRVFANPAPAPSTFQYRSIEPTFDVWGWSVQTDRDRAVEFQRLSDTGRSSLTLTGSGTTTVTTPPLFRGARTVDVPGATPGSVAPDAAGRIRFTVDLGPANQRQQNTPGTTTPTRTRKVTFSPHASLRITEVTSNRRRIRVCAASAGGTSNVRIGVSAKRLRTARSTTATISDPATCTTLKRVARRTARRATVVLTGKDLFGHPVTARRTISLKQ